MNKRNILYAKLAIIMAVIYQSLAVAVVFLRPDLGVYWHTISEWAIGKYGWVMQLAFISSGLSYLFLLLTVKPVINGRFGKLGLILLFCCFAGTVGVGIFVTDPYPPDFTITQTLIHTICGTLAMLLLPIAALLINYNLVKKNSGFAHLKNALLLTGIFPLIALIGFILQVSLCVVPLGENTVGENVPIGYPPRILFFIYHLWLIVLAGIVIKRRKQLTN